MRRIVIPVLVAAVAVATAAVALASSSPKAVRASIVAAVLAQSSVHWTSTFNGHGTVAITADVNGNSGVKQVTWDRGAGTVQILSVGGTAYVEGDAQGLRRSLGLTQTQATRYASRWISIPKGDNLYAVTFKDLTLASIVHNVIPEGTLTLRRTMSHGTRLFVLRGKLGRDFISSVAAHVHGKRLPVTFTAGGIDTFLRGSFSKWNEPVTVQAPASSTPIATVRGS